MFKHIKDKVIANFNELSNGNLFVVDLEPRVLFDAYLEGLPENERQEHNCNCCRHFLNHYGNIVGIVDGKLKTLWEFDVVYPYDKVPDILDKIVRSASIANVFVSDIQKLGTNFNFGSDKTRWEHFYVELPKTKVLTSANSIATTMGQYRTSKETFKRALDELTLDSVGTVLELITQNSIYRGAEFKKSIETFLEHKSVYDDLSDQEKELYAWSNYNANVTGIRNSVIGSLLVDLSEDRSLDSSVSAFESKVAPQNYKRPTAIVTKSMIDQAEKKIVELGLEESLHRRYATMDDIPVNDLLFVNRKTSSATKSLLSNLKDDVQVNVKSFSKIEEIPIDKFITDVVPTLTKIEVLLEQKQSRNFMTLVAPENSEAPLLFNWDNGISWSYSDGLTDSLKERVKSAGGSVEGELRISLEWFNFDDLDLHVIEPNGNKIYFPSKVSHISGGFLDVDMNAGGGQSREAVENIIFKDKSRMLEGVYQVRVNNFAKRETKDLGFNIEVECQDMILNYGQATGVADNDTINVVSFNYSKTTGISNVVSHIAEKETPSKEIWNISTNKFHNVNMLMLSPNFWNNKQYGNKHWFFILDKAKNPESPRGLFNEFLKPELYEHKRVFELLGNKIVVKESGDELSGLGFSSTQSSELTCRITDKSQRIVKIKF